MPETVLTDSAILQKLTNKGHSAGRIGKFNVAIDGQWSFRRDGSDKLPKGWQITIRDDFRSSVLKGQGFLLVARGRGLLIPLKDLRDFVGSELGQNNTIDIFITFGGVCTLECKGATYDVSGFAL